ncbi:BTAD domain-containing putative transcriptional regulator [Streptomyces sanyensis]|uniref:OmpR/PhoB-type domain-containing protein n=1 Tax=Streptomyces sanyensis TaxID=568869 RepID=A0ABP8ZW11_9ACTN
MTSEESSPAPGGAPPLRIELLGPVRAWRQGREIPLGPPKQRAVLCLLACRADEFVAVETIVDALWGSDVPQTAVNGVHTYVAGLRRVLEPGRGRREGGALLTSESGGYRLRIDAGEVDAVLFAQHRTTARRLRGDGDLDGALRWHEAALGLWHGAAYSGVPGPFAARERRRLADLRLTTVEEWAEDLLEAGRHGEAVTELFEAVAEEPLRERLRWLLMLGLYRSGRQAHALAVYAETRRMMSRELGIEPGFELRTLHQQILAGSPELAPSGGPSGAPAATATGAPQEAPRPPADARRAPAADREGPSAPLAAGMPRPLQLPPLARGFVGREAELSWLEGRLRDTASAQGSATPIAVVDGPAGVGKSAFVLKLAHRLLDRYPDGQLYVDLDAPPDPWEGHPPRCASEALRRLLGTLGVEPARIPPDLASRAALYRSVLSGRRMLVVLDGVAEADQLRPLVPRGSSCVLATSRERLTGLAVRDGAHMITLGPLSDSESAQLLRSLTRSGLVEGQAATSRLVRLCKGLPMPLREAAVRLDTALDPPDPGGPERALGLAGHGFPP